MKVNYQLPASRVSGFGYSLGLGLVAMVVALWVFVVFAPSVGSLLAALMGAGMVFGANTVTYSWPVSGVTAPTAAQSRTHQSIVATITGDGAATSFTMTHNWHLSTAELAAGWPIVVRTELLAAGYTAAITVTSKATDTVVFGNTAFSGAGLQITLLRPWTALR